MMKKELIVESGIGIFADHIPILKKKQGLFMLLCDCAEYHINKLLNEHPDLIFDKIKISIDEKYVSIGKLSLVYIFKSI